MSKKNGIVFVVLFVVAAALIAGGAVACGKAEESSQTKSVEKTEESEAKTESAQEKEPEIKEITVDEPVEEIVEKEIVEEPVPVEEPVEEIVEEPVPVEEPVEQPAPQRRRRSVAEDLGGMNPLGRGELPSKEEAISSAREILSRYREASPEEKQQIAMGLAMMQGVISGLSQNAGALLQQLPPEERERIVNSAAASQELIEAVQQELAGEMTDEEAQIFGGLFQAFRNVGQAFSNSQPNIQQQQP